jgi:hypothetical protein
VGWVCEVRAQRTEVAMIVNDATLYETQRPHAALPGGGLVALPQDQA